MVIEAPEGYAHIGIDETGYKKLGGLVALRLDPIKSAEFFTSTQNLLSTFDLDEFHGRKFNRSQEEAYFNFLLAIHSSFLGSEIGKLRILLFDKEEYDNFTSKEEQTIHAFLGESSNLNDRSIRNLAKALASIYWLALERESILKDVTNYSLELDQLSFPIDLDEMMFLDIQGAYLREKKEYYFKKVFQSYLEKKFKNEIERNDCPEIEDVKFLDSNESALIQAADVIGNFHLAQVRTYLDPDNSGETARLKTRMLEESFDEKLDIAKFDLSNLYVQDGDILCREKNKWTHIDIIRKE